MIFYTLKGLNYELEIYAHKIRVVKKFWMRIIPSANVVNSWDIDELLHFQVSGPKFLFLGGKIQWQTKKGDVGHFRFTTSPAMVKKIETYIQKRIEKTQQPKALIIELRPKKLKKNKKAAA